MIHEDDEEGLIKNKRGETLTQKIMKGLKPKLKKSINFQNIPKENSNEPQDEMIAKMADQKVSNAVIIQKNLKLNRKEKNRRILMDDNDLLPKKESISLGQKPNKFRGSVITITGGLTESLINYPLRRGQEMIVEES